MIEGHSCSCGHVFQWRFNSPPPEDQSQYVSCPECGHHWYFSFRRGRLFSALLGTWSDALTLRRHALLDRGRVIAEELYPDDEGAQVFFFGNWADQVDVSYPRRAPLFVLRLVTSVRKLRARFFGKPTLETAWL